MYDKRAFRGTAALDGAWSPASQAPKETFWSRAIAVVLGFGFSALVLWFAVAKNW